MSLIERRIGFGGSIALLIRVRSRIALLIRICHSHSHRGRGGRRRRGNGGGRRRRGHSRLGRLRYGSGGGRWSRRCRSRHSWRCRSGGGSDRGRSRCGSRGRRCRSRPLRHSGRRGRSNRTLQHYPHDAADQQHNHCHRSARRRQFRRAPVEPYARNSFIQAGGAASRLRLRRRQGV